MRQEYERAAIFLFGASMGTVIGLVLAALYKPYSGLEQQTALYSRSQAWQQSVMPETDDVAQRIRQATDTWVAQLRQIADDMVAQGRLSSEEARSQVNELLAKVRS
jgi:gas vesicle protein